MRIAAAFAVSLLLAAAAGALLAASLSTLLGRRDEQARLDAERRELAELVAEAEALRGASYAVVLREGPREHLDAALLAFEEHVAQLRAGAGGPGELQELLDAAVRWVAEGPRVVGALAADGNHAAAATLLGSGREEELFAELRAAADRADAAYASEAAAQTEELRRAAAGSLLMAVVAGLAIAGASAAALRALRAVRTSRERVRQTEEARRAAEELARARRELLTFATDELRGPATAIELAARLLAADPERVSPDLRRRVVEDLAACARRLVLLSETLVDLVALHAGRLVPVRERADVASLLEELVRDVQLSRSDFRPVIEVEGRLPAALVDPVQVRRALGLALAALLRSGAREVQLQASAGPAGGPRLKIVVRPGPSTVAASAPGTAPAAVLDPLVRNYLQGVLERQRGSVEIEQSEDAVRLVVDLPVAPPEGEVDSAVIS